MCEIAKNFHPLQKDLSKNVDARKLKLSMNITFKK